MTRLSKAYHIDHKNIENRWTLLSFKVDMIFILNDIDLQMTLTFKKNTSKQLKYVNYDILFI